jgi:glycosyltransferase involved in cell wall biosynthesis
MERPIVASSLDQIGQVLAHERTALLVEPGDAASLAAGLRRVVEDRGLGRRLAIAARAEVLEKYTWRRHVQEILTALERSAT